MDCDILLYIFRALSEYTYQIRKTTDSNKDSEHPTPIEYLTWKYCKGKPWCIHWIAIFMYIASWYPRCWFSIEYKVIENDYKRLESRPLFSRPLSPYF